MSNRGGSQIIDVNYADKLERIKSRVTTWNEKGLTTFGRIHLVKSEILSQLVCGMSVLPAPNRDFVKTIEKWIFQFVWGGKEIK